MTKKLKNIDLSNPRRSYYSNECNLTICSECGSDLIEENSTILLFVKSDSEEGEFMTNLSASHFCNVCTVVVFDTDMVDKAAKAGIRGNENIRQLTKGLRCLWFVTRFRHSQ